MAHDDYEQFYEPRTARQKRRSPKRSARDLVHRLGWLHQQPVRWGGPANRAPDVLVPGWEPVSRRLEQHLRGNPVGLYAVQLQSAAGSATAPRVESVQSVHAQLLADAAAMLSQIGSQKRQIARLVDDFDTWSASCQERLTMFAKLSQAVEADPKTVETLVLETDCIWLGNGRNRPSRQVASADLERYLHGEVEYDASHTLAAVILGARPHTESPRPYASQVELGLLLRKWDPDLLARLGPPATAAAAGQLLQRCPELAKPAWTGLLREYLLLTSAPDLDALIRVMPELLETWKRLCNEGRERQRCLLELFGQALQQGPPVYHNTAAKRSRRNHDFDSTCRALLAERLAQQGLARPLLNPDQDPLQAACRWLLGFDLDAVELEALQLLPAVEGEDHAYQFMEQLRRVLKARQAVPHAACRAVAVAAGRLSAGFGPALAVPALSRWLDHCRSCCPPGPEGCGPIRLALDAVSWTSAASQTRQGARRCLQILESYGQLILQTTATTVTRQGGSPDCESLSAALTESPDACLPLALAAIPELYEDFIPLLFEARLTKWLQSVYRDAPANVALAMEFLSEADDRWYALSPGSRLLWAELLRLPNQNLARTLGCRFSTLAADENAHWDELEPVLHDLLRFLVDHDDRDARQEFLADHLSFLETLLTSAFVDADRADPSCRAADHFYRRMPLLEAVYQWGRFGFAKVAAMFDRLQAACDQLDNQRQDHGQDYFPPKVEVELAVALSAGVPERLLHTLMHEPQQSHSYPAEPIDGWRFLSQRPAVTGFLSSLMERPDLIIRVKLLLQRLALALRLQSTGSLNTGLDSWESVTPAAAAGLPAATPKRQRQAMCVLLAWLERLPEERRELPKSVSKILRRPEQLSRELANLRRRAEGRGPSPTVARRLKNLEHYIREPDALNAWVERDLEKELAKQLDLHRLIDLEQLVADAIQQHWQLLNPNIDIHNDPDWDNALLLATTIGHNRRLLKELLRMTARGKPQWFRKHPANQRFLKQAEAAGVNVVQWCGDYARTFQIRGGTFRGWVENNPLRVLQMGNLFGTCLGVGGENAYATVANAIEINKRVVYVANARGHIVGRKLLAMDPRGQVYAFHAYGEGAWLKIQLDRFCADYIHHCGGRIVVDEVEAGVLHRRLQLFADWYLDTVEPFDWWVSVPCSRQQLQEDLLRNFPKRLHADEPGVIRALLVLGNQAIPVIQKHRNKLSSTALRRIQRESDDRELAAWLSCRA